MISTPPQPMGTWQITLFLMYGPQQVMGQEAGTIAAIFPSYNRNSKLVSSMAISRSNRVSRRRISL